MKIRELRFKNLNSLKGEWIIDFTRPKYADEGIFVLSGPTGAGKTTVLDAICLALYGKTPRLGKITDNENEIMTRHCAECYAEVLFESQAGVFLCRWGQRRANKKATGKLQNVERHIADANNKIIENKKTAVDKVVEEKTGMDFGRFTRSIMLAQGDFDSFLKAKVDQKSEVLEQITDSEIYSQISKQVFNHEKKEREKLALLEEEIKNTQTLQPQEEKEIRSKLQETEKQATELATEIDRTNEAVKWRQGIATLTQKINKLDVEKKELQEKMEAFKPQREKLERAKKASSMESKHDRFSDLRKDQKEEREALKMKEELLPALKSSAEKQAALHKTAEQDVRATKETLEKETPHINKVRLLDQSRDDLRSRILKEKESHRTDEEEIARLQQAIAKQQQQKESVAEKLQHAQDYLAKNSQDEWLVSGLEGVKEQLRNFSEQQQKATNEEAELTKAKTVVVQETEKYNQLVKQYDVVKQGHKQATEKLLQGEEKARALLNGRSIQQYREEKETLLREMVHERLEEHRAQLKDGEPCPLCGSTEHPYAKNAPESGAKQEVDKLTMLITKAEKHEQNNKKLKAAKEAAHRDMTESEKLAASADSGKKTAKKEVDRLHASVKKLQDNVSAQKQSVLEKLQPLGITRITDPSTLLDSLNNRLQKWQQHKQQQEKTKAEQADISSEIKSNDAVVKEKTSGLTKKQQTVPSLQKDYDKLSDERVGFYGEKNPDKEEERLKQALANAEAVERKNRELNDTHKQELKNTENDIVSARTRIEERQTNLQKAEDAFTTALQSAGFSDERQFLDAKLTEHEQQKLVNKEKQFNDSETGIKARQQEYSKQLKEEENKKITDKSLTQLEQESEQSREQQTELQEAITAIKMQLLENDRAKKQIKEKQEAIDAQKKEHQRWKKLYECIGSQDGKKYRNYAQGLTFELLIAHANEQLKIMTDRYILKHESQQPLQLHVVDNYQAGEVRPTKNLSGGESFLVSLTLALGLSKMSSKKVRVDSLFLDEGFGTLDEESLESALETLSTLQQSGKLIGVISHVQKLKDRIMTQIQVTPVSAGHSTLEGPGCEAVNG